MILITNQELEDNQTMVSFRDSVRDYVRDSVYNPVKRFVGASVGRSVRTFLERKYL